MTDIESLIAELQTEGWHYQRVRHLAMRALHLAEDELADVHSRGELTERLLVLVLTKASQAPAPAAERTAAPVLKLAPPAPAPEPEPAPLLDPDAEILVVIDGAWVFGFAPAGETDKVEALKVGAQALAPGGDIKLVPHVGAWPPYLKAWSERPGKTRAPVLSVSPASAGESVSTRTTAARKPGAVRRLQDGGFAAVRTMNLLAIRDCLVVRFHSRTRSLAGQVKAPSDRQGRKGRASGRMSEKIATCRDTSPSPGVDCGGIDPRAVCLGTQRVASGPIASLAIAALPIGGPAWDYGFDNRHQNRYPFTIRQESGGVCHDVSNGTSRGGARPAATIFPRCLRRNQTTAWLFVLDRRNLRHGLALSSREMRADDILFEQQRMRCGNLLAGALLHADVQRRRALRCRASVSRWVLRSPRW